VRQVEHFNRAFSTLVSREFELGLEMHDASEALAAGKCCMGRATCQFGLAAARFVPETSRG